MNNVLLSSSRRHPFRRRLPTAQPCRANRLVARPLLARLPLIRQVVRCRLHVWIVKGCLGRFVVIVFGAADPRRAGRYMTRTTKADAPNVA